MWPLLLKVGHANVASDVNLSVRATQGWEKGAGRCKGTARWLCIPPKTVLSPKQRFSLLLTGALNQSLWNRFSPSKGLASGPARLFKDLDTFGGAASDSWGSPRLLWRTKGL